MATLKMIVLAFAAGITVVTLPGISRAASQNGSTLLFIPNESHERNKENNENNENHENNERMRHQGGEHYDNVVGNYTRRCVSLDTQFKHLQARVGAESREASSLHDQGVRHCNSGGALQGIDELSEAIRKIGGIPRVEL
jgi:hypothetical protein